METTSSGETAATDTLARFEAATDPNEREALVRSAEDLDTPAAVAMLSRALRDKDTTVRYTAVEEIGALGLGEFVGMLTEMVVRDRHYLVRTLAAESLGMLGDPAAVPALMGALRDRNWLVRGWAVSALAHFPASGVAEPIHEVLAADRSHFVRVTALAALLQLCEPDHWPALLSELRYRHYRIRCATATVLGRLADRTNVDRILPALAAALRREKTVAARSSICEALVQIARFDAGAIDPLEESHARMPDDEVIAGALRRARKRRGMWP